jgi:hypothetical protein
MPDAIMLIDHTKQEINEDSLKLVNDELLRILNVSEYEEKNSVINLVK